MAGRRGIRRGLLSAALVLIAVIVFLTLQGKLPLPGDRASEGDGSAGEPKPVRTADPSAEAKDTEPADVTAGRGARLAWLVENDRIDDAVALAKALAAGESAAERALGASYLEADGAIRQTLESRLRKAFAAGDLAAAERTWRRLVAQFPGLARALDLPPAQQGGPTLASVLEPHLPVALAEGREIWRVRGSACVLRVKGSSGGVRYETVAATALAPAHLHRAVHAAAGKVAAAAALGDLARELVAAGRPLAAWVMATGRAELPELPRRSGPGAAGKPR